MTACNPPTLRAPFPYFGGKRGASELIWQLLGDPGGYVEPFCGSAAALLARPGWQPVGWRRVETLNDADGWLVNTWRAIRHRPTATARWAAGPITEIDLHAIAAYLAERRGPDLVAWLEGHPLHCDPVMAGWWLRLQAAQLAGSVEGGPWVRHHGRLVDSRHATTDTPPRRGRGSAVNCPTPAPAKASPATCRTSATPGAVSHANSPTPTPPATAGSPPSRPSQPNSTGSPNASPTYASPAATGHAPSPQPPPAPPPEATATSQSSSTRHTTPARTCTRTAPPSPPTSKTGASPRPRPTGGSSSAATRASTTGSKRPAGRCTSPAPRPEGTARRAAQGRGRSGRGSVSGRLRTSPSSRAVSSSQTEVHGR